METETIVGSQHVQAIRLFSFNMNSLTLHSLNNRELWTPGEIKQSVCNHARHHGHLKPEPHCTCGIWACKGRKGLKRTFPMLHSPNLNWLSAQVEQWGVVIEHEWGYRSEFARIIPATIQTYPRPHNKQHKKLLEFLRQKYEGG